jgi:hypothetical protein
MKILGETEDPSELFMKLEEIMSTASNAEYIPLKLKEFFKKY